MDLRDLFPGPRAYFIFAAVLAICFIVGLKKKPDRNEDGAWMWWMAMTVFAGCIIFLVLKALEIL
jgi:hypothetical protein